MPKRNQLPNKSVTFIKNDLNLSLEAAQTLCRIFTKPFVNRAHLESELAGKVILPKDIKTIDELLNDGNAIFRLWKKAKVKDVHTSWVQFAATIARRQVISRNALNLMTLLPGKMSEQVKDEYSLIMANALTQPRSKLAEYLKKACTGHGADEGKNAHKLIEKLLNDNGKIYQLLSMSYANDEMLGIKSGYGAIDPSWVEHIRKKVETPKFEHDVSSLSVRLRVSGESAKVLVQLFRHAYIDQSKLEVVLKRARVKDSDIKRIKEHPEVVYEFLATRKHKTPEYQNNKELWRGQYAAIVNYPCLTKQIKPLLGWLEKHKVSKEVSTLHAMLRHPFGKRSSYLEKAPNRKVIQQLITDSPSMHSLIKKRKIVGIDKTWKQYFAGCTMVAETFFNDFRDDSGQINRAVRHNRKELAQLLVMVLLSPKSEMEDVFDELHASEKDRKFIDFLINQDTRRMYELLYFKNNLDSTLRLKGVDQSWDQYFGLRVTHYNVGILTEFTKTETVATIMATLLSRPYDKTMGNTGIVPGVAGATSDELRSILEDKGRMQGILNTAGLIGVHGSWKERYKDKAGDQGYYNEHATYGLVGTHVHKLQTKRANAAIVIGA